MERDFALRCMALFVQHPLIIVNRTNDPVRSVLCLHSSQGRIIFANDPFFLRLVHNRARVSVALRRTIELNRPSMYRFQEAGLPSPEGRFLHPDSQSLCALLEGTTGGALQSDATASNHRTENDPANLFATVLAVTVLPSSTLTMMLLGLMSR